MKIELHQIIVAGFDLIRTTIDARIQKTGLEVNQPFVLCAYKDSLAKAAIDMPSDELGRYRGRDKLEVFLEIICRFKTDLTFQQQILLA